MRIRFLALASAVSFFWFGCGRTPSQSPPGAVLAATNAASVGAPSELAAPPAADPTALLAELTQALRKYSVEQRRVPASLNELVAAGYLSAAPRAPDGKQFRIDAKNVRVIFK